MKKQLIILVLILAASSVAFAQPPEPPEKYGQGGPGFGFGDDSMPPFGKGGPGPFGMDRRLEQLRMLKALELLDLDEETEAKFIVQFRKQRKEMQAIMEQRMELTEKMSELVKNEKTTDAEYEKLFAEINELDKKFFGQFKANMNAMKKLLTNEQMAKLYIFQMRFDRELMGKMRERGSGKFHGPKPDKR